MQKLDSFNTSKNHFEGKKPITPENNQQVVKNPESVANSVNNIQKMREGGDPKKVEKGGNGLKNIFKNAWNDAWRDNADKKKALETIGRWFIKDKRPILNAHQIEKEMKMAEMAKLVETNKSPEGIPIRKKVDDITISNLEGKYFPPLETAIPSKFEAGSRIDLLNLVKGVESSFMDESGQSLYGNLEIKTSENGFSITKIHVEGLSPELAYYNNFKPYEIKIDEQKSTAELEKYFLTTVTEELGQIFEKEKKDFNRIKEYLWNKDDKAELEKPATSTLETNQIPEKADIFESKKQLEKLNPSDLEMKEFITKTIKPKSVFDGLTDDQRQRVVQKREQHLNPEVTLEGKIENLKVCVEKYDKEVLAFIPEKEKFLVKSRDESYRLEKYITELNLKPDFENKTEILTEAEHKYKLITSQIKDLSENIFQIRENSRLMFEQSQDNFIELNKIQYNPKATLDDKFVVEENIKNGLQQVGYTIEKHKPSGKYLVVNQEEMVELEKNTKLPTVLKNFDSGIVTKDFSKPRESFHKFEAVVKSDVAILKDIVTGDLKGKFGQKEITSLQSRISIYLETAMNYSSNSLVSLDSYEKRSSLELQKENLEIKTRLIQKDLENIIEELKPYGLQVEKLKNSLNQYKYSIHFDLAKLRDVIDNSQLLEKSTEQNLHNDEQEIDIDNYETILPDQEDIERVQEKMKSFNPEKVNSRIFRELSNTLEAYIKPLQIVGQKTEYLSQTKDGKFVSTNKAQFDSLDDNVKKIAIPVGSFDDFDIALSVVELLSKFQKITSDSIVYEVQEIDGLSKVVKKYNTQTQNTGEQIISIDSINPKETYIQKDTLIQKPVIEILPDSTQKDLQAEDRFVSREKTKEYPDHELMEIAIDESADFEMPDNKQETSEIQDVISTYVKPFTSASSNIDFVVLNPKTGFTEVNQKDFSESDGIKIFIPNTNIQSREAATIVANTYNKLKFTGESSDQKYYIHENGNGLYSVESMFTKPKDIENEWELDDLDFDESDKENPFF
jgi:hypothetical protein